MSADGWSCYIICGVPPDLHHSVLKRAIVDMYRARDYAYPGRNRRGTATATMHTECPQFKLAKRFTRRSNSLWFKITVASDRAAELNSLWIQHFTIRVEWFLLRSQPRYTMATSTIPTSPINTLASTNTDPASNLTLEAATSSSSGELNHRY